MASNEWTGSVGIFEYETDNHSSETDDDWLDDNLSSKVVDTNQYTDGDDGLLNLNIYDWEFVEDPNIEINAEAGRNTILIGLEKVDMRVRFFGYCIDDGTSDAEEKFNDIKTFERKHDSISDNDTYLIWRRKNKSNNWSYHVFEDNSDNYDRRYCKGKIMNVKGRREAYGYIEYQFEFQEGWL